MRDRVALLDTNVLGVAADLSTPLWVSILRLCAHADIEPCIPEIVLHESMNLRREQYLEASTRFLSAFKQISRFFDAQPVYVPDVEEIVEQWENDLRASFTVVDTRAEDAIEALRREALRQTPARAGKGGRDSLVWLTALRLARDGREVMLVSRNTDDFSGHPSGELHQDLTSEADGVSGEIQYFVGLDPFIEHIAGRTDPPDLEPGVYVELVGFELFEAMVAAADPGRFTPEETSSAMIRLEGLSALRSYEIESRGLALINGLAILLPATSGADAEGFLTARFMAWVEFDLQSRLPTSGELQRVTVDGMPDESPASRRP